MYYFRYRVVKRAANDWTIPTKERIYYLVETVNAEGRGNGTGVETGIVMKYWHNCSQNQFELTDNRFQKSLFDYFTIFNR